MDLGIAGRIAIVTGGSRGLGRQSALALAREGCKVAICARSKEELDSAVAELRGFNNECVGILADVATPDGCRDLYSEAVSHLGEIALNLLSTVRTTRLVLPGMIDRKWGRIVNISSVFGREYGGAPSYMAAKASVIAFSKNIALTVAPNNVLVNTIAPGSIRFQGGSWDRFTRNNTPEVVEQFIDRNLPMGRFGWPEPVGETVAFLCSESANMITGASITVDGGQSRSLI